MSLIAVFDIGKTNKKFVLFDEQFTEVDRAFVHFPEAEDEDGFPGDDLPALTRWMKATLDEALLKYGDRITHLNFSTYGATLVHLDGEGNPATALYNYLKPFPEDLQELFYGRYGGRERFSLETASPALGMLNSGLQLFWLKYRRPERFARIRSTLHFPQYCSYLFTGKLFSEYTSIGCHTGLWDFEQKAYHRWVRAEQLDRLFPPLVETEARAGAGAAGKLLEAGVGIHDSSAALLPYLMAGDAPFILLSTGTWSIALNPFNTEPLTAEELRQDSLCYLRPDGKPVKAARLFLGQEHETQVQRLSRQYGKDPEAFRTIRLDRRLYRRIAGRGERVFRWRHIRLSGAAEPVAEERRDVPFDSFGAAYHQLIWELVGLQLDSLRLVLGQSPVRRLYVDGGFAGNELYLHMLADAAPGMEVIAAEASLGSALGAALAVRRTPLPEAFLERCYRLRRIG